MHPTRRQILEGLFGCSCLGVTALAELPAYGATPVTLDGLQILCTLQAAPHIRTVTGLRDGPPAAEREVGWITDLIGMRPHIEILEAEFNGGGIAIAAVRGTQRYIVYDTKWFTFADDRVSWYSVYVLGHEIGHHIYGHTYRRQRHPHQAELDADRFGGWAVARLGGRLDQALAFTRVFSETGSRTHPPRNKRIAAIREGWLTGSGRP